MATMTTNNTTGPINSSQMTTPTNQSLSNRHDMTGWWYCCHCENLVNPALLAECCPACGHFRCDHCRQV
ncbi:hypothetical protein BJX68DRAFT_59924 [Aspergillus pseudodeflectus]|uniref:RanBP2-type domain-containing protein n=1 Tax=Aspergillus pseudodeflectus TaxID=176178 RepID=A0ABR4KIQ8_9EURO